MTVYGARGAALQTGQENPRRAPGRYAFVDIDTDPQAIARPKEPQNGGQIIPTVVYRDGTHEVNLSDEALVCRIGLTLKAERSAYDPVNPRASRASSRHLRRPGRHRRRSGDASARRAGRYQRLIDNYPGFPDGISGGELADRFVARARCYGGARFGGVCHRPAARSRRPGDLAVIGAAAHLPAVIAATGSMYRMLDVPGEDNLIGATADFCATCEAPFCKEPRSS
jgi:thioredoxin reductase (NADPH)